VIQQDLGITAADFDKQFLAWLDADIGKTAANFDEWHKSLKDLAEAAKEQRNDDVIAQGRKTISLYQDYVYDANPYEFLAEAYEAKGNKKEAAAVLTDYEKRGGHDPDTLKELASLEQGLGSPRQPWIASTISIPLTSSSTAVSEICGSPKTISRARSRSTPPWSRCIQLI
jgi:cellulose synthase operon protein C